MPSLTGSAVLRAHRTQPDGHGQGSRSRFRPEIQGLRAVAVLLVVVYHLWPNRLTGGYVGVDVFFVISGYLITSHIHREVTATGTVSLRRFWARRIRRLLPASLLVLLVSLVAVVLAVPSTVWRQTAREVGASALYVQNWALAADSVDYMAADNVATVAQHYWSLSVEEQFYLVWPVLLVGLVALHRRGSGRASSLPRVLGAGLAVLVGASFVWSVVATAADQSVAYFATYTRMWEFGAGALLAIAGTRRLEEHRLAVAAAWAGLAMILGSAVLLDGASPFPGWVAVLVVVGTVLVIAVGGATGRGTPGSWLSSRPATFVGDVSYSVYLWHWPLIVVWPFVTGVPLRSVDKLVILAVTVALAWVTKVAVEDPGRVRPLLAAAPWRSFVFALVGMAVVVGACVVVTAEVDRRAEAGDDVVVGVTGCEGPAALDPAQGCVSVVGEGPLVPSLENAIAQNTQPTYPGCQQDADSAGVVSCVLGTTADPERVVAVVGDSHATQWFPALDRLGQDRGWEVRTYTRSGCPATPARRVIDREQTDDRALACERWVDEVTAALIGDDDVSLVLTAARTSAYGWEQRPDGALADPAVDGFRQLWRTWTAAGKDVVVLADIPGTGRDEAVPDCLARAEDRLACTTPRAQALVASPLVTAARAEDHAVVDLTDRFCDDDTCYPVVGDVLVYRDSNHLTAQYAEALVPWLDAAMAEGESARR